jgi:Ca2+-binding RTX toxin-like protein
MAVVRGTDADDCLSGFDTGEVFDAAAGNDYIYGYGGNDTIAGGIGSDYLDGGDGSDTYRFSVGDGSDIVDDNGMEGATDTIEFLGSISKESIAFFQGDSDSVLVCAYGDRDRITVYDQRPQYDSIERVQLNNGFFLTSDDINLVIQQMTAYANSNGINLTTVDDVKKNQELMSIIVSAWHQ